MNYNAYGKCTLLRTVRLIGVTIRRKSEEGGDSARLTHVTRLCPTVGKGANELKGPIYNTKSHDSKFKIGSFNITRFIFLARKTDLQFKI
jgi:hypothetical protein